MTTATRRHFTTPDGLQLCADCYGDSTSPAVLLSHGGGQTRHAWAGTAKKLAERGWYAVAYDHRGHGDSDWSPDGVYNGARFASDQGAIAAELHRPVLVGASLGGLSAMLAGGESNPRLYSAVVLVDVTPNLSATGAANIIAFMSTHLEDGFASLEEAADVIARYTGRPRRKDVSGLRKNLRQKTDGRWYWHWDPAFVTVKGEFSGEPQRLADATRNIDAPLLLIRGRESDLVTEEIAAEFLQLRPDAQCVDVAHARHMVAGDRNDIFNDAVIEFLDRLPGAPQR